MSKNQKISIGVISVFVVVVGFFVSSNKNLLKKNDVIVGTASSLLSLSKDITCTFEYAEEGQVMEGVVYVTKNKDMRGDFVTTHPEKGSVEAHTIQKGGYVYSWGLPDRPSTKIKISENSVSENQTVDGNSRKISNRPDVQYSCKPWRVVSSKFEIPKEIAFQDK